MDYPKFKNYLRQSNISERAQSDCLSRCVRVERDLQTDLNSEYTKDKGISLIEKLSYSNYDEKIIKPLPGNLVIDGSKQNGMNSLKSAVKRYFEFKEQA